MEAIRQLALSFSAGASGSSLISTRLPLSAGGVARLPKGGAQPARQATVSDSNEAFLRELGFGSGILDGDMEDDEEEDGSAPGQNKLECARSRASPASRRECLPNPTAPPPAALLQVAPS